MAFGNAYTMRYGSKGGGLSGFGLDLLEAVLDREPERVAPWRPREEPPADIAPLAGRWWWMGQEHEVGWADGELVVTPLTTGRTPWRFVPDGPAVDVWRGRSGDCDGELLRVVRDADGAVAALDIATFVFSRDPWPSV